MMPPTEEYDLKPIVAYKAFDKDMMCRGFQYEVGQTYTHDGKVEICESGFHACLSPFDCWAYYNLTDSRFAVVELSGDTKEQGCETKIASAEITVKAELALPEFIKAGVDWLIGATKDKDESGGYAQIGSSGNAARIGSSGDSAQIGSSGDSAQIGSSGDSARIGSSGYFAHIGSSGDYAQIGSSGDSAQIGAAGKDSVVASAGRNAKAKGAAGTWISIAEYKGGKCVGFATGCIGEGGLEPDTYYEARNGALVPA